MRTRQPVLKWKTNGTFTFDAAGRDFLTLFDEWLNHQRGVALGNADVFDATRRFRAASATSATWPAPTASPPSTVTLVTPVFAPATEALMHHILKHAAVEGAPGDALPGKSACLGRPLDQPWRSNSCRT